MDTKPQPEPEISSVLSPTLTEEERLLLAGKELDASEQDWEAADVLVSQRLHRVALTRAAMSLFHAARGLLLREGYNVRDPEDVLELLSLRFSGAGEMPPEAPAVLARAQTYCDLADFGVGWVVTPERVVAEIEVYEEHRTGLLAMLAQRGVKPGAS
jgi:uncharacterized protein (UPF0332 family)